MATSVAGRQVTAYTGNAAYFNLSFKIKKCPAQKDTNTEALETNSDVNSSKSFLGKSQPKSFSWYRDVCIDNNITTAVKEKHRAMSDEIDCEDVERWMVFGFIIFLLYFKRVFDTIKNCEDVDRMVFDFIIF